MLKTGTLSVEGWLPACSGGWMGITGCCLTMETGSAGRDTGWVEICCTTRSSRGCIAVRTEKSIGGRLTGTNSRRSTNPHRLRRHYPMEGCPLEVYLVDEGLSSPPLPDVPRRFRHRPAHNRSLRRRRPATPGDRTSKSPGTPRARGDFPGRTVSVKTLLTAGWIVGSAVMTGFLFYANLSFWRKLRRLRRHYPMEGCPLEAQTRAHRLCSRRRSRR
mgnify:CR=1 FL=1